ncbi:MAG: DNA helicase RecQ [Bacteroidetes bacterium HGW-Bacteroidetes-6]|nr:MAG: DNA helicase RecQ [Bacteroidetes bacterium HGW-Bacteroidetes-6]
MRAMLKSVFGFERFKGEQQEIIESLLAGKDTFVIMPTGGGKSLCYQLPALLLPGTAIVISPLIALMKNQVDNIRNFGAEDGIAHVMNSSLSKTEMNVVHEDLLSGKTKLLYVAPESLTKDENVEFLQKINISFYAIDEAHCISEWGHDFRPEYRRIRPIVDAIGKRVPLIALTATATPKVQQDILKTLRLIDPAVFISSFNRPNLYYEVRPKYKDVNRELLKFVKQNEGKSGIVYCLSRKKTEELAEFLQVNGIKALPYHAGLDASVRRQNQDMFLMEEVDVMIATIAFGMGIDKPDIRYVVHYDMPKSLESYYQETGRSGRDGGEGQCIAFYSIDDLQKFEKFSKDKGVAEQEIAQHLLIETISFAESSVCRRKQLLHYFGENYHEDNCQSCDNCLFPRDTFEGEEEALLVLDTIDETQEQFKTKSIVDIVTGSKSPSMKQLKAEKLSVFGKGGEKPERYWNSVVRQLLIMNYLAKDIENYGVLKITEKGKDYLNNPTSLMLTKDRNIEEEKDEDAMNAADGRGSGTDKALFGMLKDLRKQIAKKENLPPFVIFQDPSLEDMAIQYPVTMEELKNITGVGTGKAQKYGDPFLKLISGYVEENEIIRPMDMVVKSPVNKSGLKVYIIQAIDRKVALEDLATAKNLMFEELLDELERIVSSGTRLNLNFYIDEYVDPYHQEEIFDYFRQAETDSIENALLELGENEYSVEEIRLMRIKFMSDLGN